MVEYQVQATIVNRLRLFFTCYYERDGTYLNIYISRGEVNLIIITTVNIYCILIDFDPLIVTCVVYWFTSLILY